MGKGGVRVEGEEVGERSEYHYLYLLRDEVEERLLNSTAPAPRGKIASVGKRLHCCHLLIVITGDN